jgi:hypothetical protein
MITMNSFACTWSAILVSDSFSNASGSEFQPKAIPQLRDYLGSANDCRAYNLLQIAPQKNS